MLLPDETLEIMADKFQLNGEETIMFIEQMRAVQVEIIIKSFLVYYEANKGRLELDYLEAIGHGLEKSPKEYIPKLRSLIITEVENNPEVVMFLEKRMVSFISTLLAEFTKDQDEETVRKIVESIVMELDIAQSIAIKSNLP